MCMVWLLFAMDLLRLQGCVCLYVLVYVSADRPMLIYAYILICCYGGVVWCAGVYGRAMPMCLCLCVVSYVCVLCHVLVVYSLSVLEWLGCLSYAVAGGSVIACGLPWCLYLVTYVLTL